MRPLPVATDASVTYEMAAPSPAVALFAQRAQAVHPGFPLTAANVANVVGIGRRLDGQPLALEVAAACLPALPPETLLADNRQTLALLTRGRRHAPGGASGLRKGTAWSYDLLTPPEQHSFSQTCRVSCRGCGLAMQAIADDGDDAP